MNILNTENPNNYAYTTKHLEVHVLGGLKITKLESLRVTLSVQKSKQHDTSTSSVHSILRQSIDLYNDNQVEKLVRKTAERLEIGTSITRRILQELTQELENYRFLLIEKRARSIQAILQRIKRLRRKSERIGFFKTKRPLGAHK